MVYAHGSVLNGNFSPAASVKTRVLRVVLRRCLSSRRNSRKQLLLSVFPGELDLAVGYPSPLTEWKTLPEKLPILDRPACYFPDRTFCHNAMVNYLEGIPVVYLNTMDSFDAYVQSTRASQTPPQEPFHKPLPLYLGEILHELFHSYQFRERQALPPEPRLHLTKIDFPYQDSEICLLLGIEGRILSELLTTSDKSARAHRLSEFATVRAERRRRMDPDLVRIEQEQELLEGTAQYVGWSLQYASDPNLTPLEAVSKDPRLDDLYASAQNRDAAIAKSLSALEEPARNQYFQYAYYTGMGVCSVLDELQPDWKQNLFARHRSLDELLSGKLAPATDTGACLRSLSARYDADAILKHIEELLAPLRARQIAHIQEFQSTPGRRYKLVLDGIKPRNIEISAPVKLSESQRLRLFEIGVNQLGGKNDRDEGVLLITFEKAVPALFNKEDGQLELVLPSDAPVPQISAKQVEHEGERTTYSGDVRFENGSWTWRGPRLVIVNSSREVTMRFSAQ
jgi:hypothetical protein